MNSLTSTDGSIVIVKDSETGLLGAVVCPANGSVVFEDGNWVDFVESETSPLSKTLKTDRTMSELDIVGEAVFDRPHIPRKIPDDAQEKYVEAALSAINAFKQGGKS